MIKLKSILSEKTLYHGTLLSNIPSIEKFGLMPSVGEFTSNSYDMTGYGEEVDPDDYLKELVFMTDKEQLDKAVTAITAQIGHKLNKSFHSVTDDEFIRYGAIVKVYDGDSCLERRPVGDEKWGDDHPYTVEPGDYYSSSYVGIDEILTGHRMIRLLKRYGVWPRLYPIGGGDEKYLRSELIRLALKYHKDVSKDKILNVVKNYPRNSLVNKIQTYKKALGEKI